MAARNVRLPEEAIFHSDRGSNYTSAEFTAELDSRHQAVSRQDRIYYDNALTGRIASSTRHKKST
jgi:hypothetical protein